MAIAEEGAVKGQYLGAGRGWRRLTRLCLRGHLLTGLRQNTRDDRRGKVYTMRYCVFCARIRKKKSGKGIGWRRRESCCPVGHPYEGANLGLQVVVEGGKRRETRLCKACRRQSHARYRASVRAAARLPVGVGEGEVAA